MTTAGFLRLPDENGEQADVEVDEVLRLCKQNP